MSFDIYTSFATDEKLEVVGVWHDLDEKGKSRIKVARMDNPKYQNALSKQYAQHAEALRDEKSEKRTEPGSVTRKVMGVAIAEALLLDWEGISYKGEVLKYTKKNAEMVLAHKDFLEMVLQLATDIDNFRVKEEEDQVKN